MPKVRTAPTRTVNEMDTLLSGQAVLLDSINETVGENTSALLDVQADARRTRERIDALEKTAGDLHKALGVACFALLGTRRERKAARAQIKRALAAHRAEGEK